MRSDSEEEYDAYLAEQAERRAELKRAGDAFIHVIATELKLYVILDWLTEKLTKWRR